MKDKWYQSKTVWTGVTGVVTAVAAYCTGQLALGDALQVGMISLVGIFLRTGMMPTKAGK